LYEVGVCEKHTELTDIEINEIVGNDTLENTDINGSALVDVNDGTIKLPKYCGIITTIVYDHYKFAKVVGVSPNYDYFRLEFWQKDNPKQVTVNWVIPYLDIPNNKFTNKLLGRRW
jgi:hypothetical protein